MSKNIRIHRKDATESAINKCVHFGFCTAVCPTYVLDGEENDSPRGRIALAKEMMETGKPTAKTIKHLDRCLSCLSCETTCAANVPYRDIIDGAREFIESSDCRPWHERVFRNILARTMTTPSLLRISYSLCKRIPRALGHIPGPVGALITLSRAPAVNAFQSRGSDETVVLDQTPSEVRKVALLTGCVQSILGEEINAATIRFLRRAGVVVVPTNENLCCGALELHMGRRRSGTEKSIQLVKFLASLLNEGVIDSVLTTTSGCNSVIQHFDEVLADSPELFSDVAKVKSVTLDITEFALHLNLTSSGVADGAQVAYHDACSMTHGLKLTRQPRLILAQLNLEARNITESHLCCGSAGVYNILQSGISTRLGTRKAKHASAGRPDVIAAGNLGCLIQISRFTEIPVAHTVQLMDWATGGPAPRGLENFQRRELKRTDDGVDNFDSKATAVEETFW